MIRSMLIHGSISGAVIAVVSFGSMALAGDESRIAGSEWLGYTIMIVALAVIFFAVRSYRDEQLGGVIGFWTAMRLGLGISLVAGVVYVLGWEIYYQATGGDFMQQYAASYLEQMRADGVGAAELDAARSRMAEFQDLYDFLPVRMGITLIEILPVGVLISLVSAALLRRA